MEKLTGYGNHATLEVLGGKGDQNGALVLLPPTDNSENSIYFATSKLTTGFTTGTTGAWALGNSIGFTDNSCILWNPSDFANLRIQQNGNATFSNTFKWVNNPPL